ncbi:MAG TPA: M20/M25/M40 family metallo-hydrolase [Nitrososphaerales archaeon]|nr:M20/M25/M40 family metallo-hydrolase [Nitrososphaerales archaeon]
MKQVFDYIDSVKDRSIEALKQLVRQPSVSATGQGIKECASLVAKMLENLGASPKILDVEKGGASPLVVGEIRSKMNPQKTLLFYNHYDVQPPEPLEQWESPPFEPRVSGGRVYGRGCADDKGELIGRLKLTEAFLEAWGDVPCNFKFLIEGEEETGSIHLEEYFKKYPESFKADSVVWEFGGINVEGRPMVTLGVKGILYVELVARNAKVDAHSSLAAIIDNPAWRLVAALNTIKKADKILVPGWYKDVRSFTKEEIELLKRAPSEEQAIKRNYGVKSFVNRARGLEVKKALAGKPTCNICGISSGYNGPGPKTVLPNEARAKIDFRLVPDQDPLDLLRKLKRHLNQGGFSDIEVTSIEHERASRTSPKQLISRAAIESAKQLYGPSRPPTVNISSAATGPMYLFDLPCIAIGGGHSESRNHAPNENLRIDQFIMGMKWVADTANLFASGTKE